MQTDAYCAKLNSTSIICICFHIQSCAGSILFSKVHSRLSRSETTWWTYCMIQMLLLFLQQSAVLPCLSMFRGIVNILHYTVVCSKLVFCFKISHREIHWVWVNKEQHFKLGNMGRRREGRKLPLKIGNRIRHTKCHYIEAEKDKRAKMQPCCQMRILWLRDSLLTKWTELAMLLHFAIKQLFCENICSLLNKNKVQNQLSKTISVMKLHPH